MLIDTHTHLFAEEFAEDLDLVIARAQEAGVQKLFLPNIDEDSVEPMLKVCNAYPTCCFPTIGLHPTSVGKDYKEKLAHLHTYLTQSHPFVAIGEVGLDLYWDKTYAKEQETALHTQIGWALEYDLPLVIHCREAYPELLALLEQYKKEPLSGVFHSFGECVEVAQQLLEYPRFFLGINGTVTFKKSTLPETLKQLPLDRLVLETDSPYLSPMPFRGRRNESGHVQYVAQKLSDIYEVSPEVVAAVTSANGTKLFKM
ncbi:MAG: TatD family hydrolase [Phocaeicola sp.]